MVRVVVSVPKMLRAWMVKVYVVLPALLPAPLDICGMPDITPVVGFNVRPSGRLPFVMLHCMGFLPETWSVWLYARKVMTFGSVVVWICGA